MTFSIVLALYLLSNPAATMKTSTDPVPNFDRYDVVWNSPSNDAAGSMPIGNGEVVLNVWVEQSTGDLMFYIARTDALSEISQILKLGGIRVHLSPSPFKDAGDFQQHLHLHDGRISISGGGTKLELLVDANSNAIQISGTTATPTEVTANVVCWRNSPYTLKKDEQGTAWSVHDAPFPLTTAADVFVGGSEPNVTWYHRNETSVVPKVLANQSLTGLKGAFDPILHRTFGGRLEGDGFVRDSPRSIRSQTPVSDFSIRIATYTAQTNTVDVWLEGLRKADSARSFLDAKAETEAWWREFWDRSWVLAGNENAEPSSQEKAVSQGYILQRYVQACQGRGQYPIKFNGGYYTVEPTLMGRKSTPDWRNWGDCHWYQNVRHMYHPMLEQGDFDMMTPFFRLYESALPLAESRARKYHHVEGAYFPETMTDWGTYSSGDYGWNRTGHQIQDVLCPYWQYAWNQGPELVAVMLDRWDYTRDKEFLQKEVLPMAIQVLKYFDTRFRRDEEGKIVLDPTQAIETYWYSVVNDMPTVAGLIAITDRLCLLPRSLVSASDRAFFSRMKENCPELPLETRHGKRQLAPAQKFDPKTSNTENPELYAVWPFQLVSLAHPKLLSEAKAAYADRLNHNDVGWGQDGNIAALLGMTDEAARILLVKCGNSHTGYRWPATWGPNYDWLPDQNHGGNLLNTTNLMLLQGEPMEKGGAIRVLPAWPKSWDVDFKLHAPGNTTVRCIARGGRIVKLDVQPTSRLKDVVWPNGWSK